MMDVEAYLLGGLMIDSDSYGRVCGTIVESDFSSNLYRAIFRIITANAEANRPFDVITVGESIGDIASVGRIAAGVASTANIEHYAGIIREKSQKKQVDQILRETLGGLQKGDLGELVADVQMRLEGVNHRNTGLGKNFKEILSAGIEAIERASSALRDGGQVGISTGLQAIDDRIGGLQAPRLIVVAARPSIGKTALVNQIALQAAENGYGVGINSLEMGEDELAIRAMANRYQVNGSALAFGHDAEIAAVCKRIAEAPINQYPIWIDADTFSLGGIVARITEWKRKHDIKLAVIDHIGLVEVEGARSANESLGKISRTLKKLAKRLDIPVIAVSQLNRNVEKEKRWPTLADLRDSGNVEQDADICIFLHAEAKDEAETNIPMHIGLLKNRVGRKGWLRERFVFNGRTQTFFENR